MRNTLRAAAALIAITATAHSQSTLLALSKHDHTLAIVDPNTLQVLYKLPIGNDPHEVIASTDGATAYVSNYGFGAFHTLAVLDLVHHTALPSIDVSPSADPTASPSPVANSTSPPKSPRPSAATTPPPTKSTGSSALARTAST
jgi:DNA-binding beta-propeller fold protein YncE